MCTVWLATLTSHALLTVDVHVSTYVLLILYTVYALMYGHMHMDKWQYSVVYVRTYVFAFSTYSIYTGVLENILYNTGFSWSTNFVA